MSNLWVEFGIFGAHENNRPGENNPEGFLDTHPLRNSLKDNNRPFLNRFVKEYVGSFIDSFRNFPANVKTFFNEGEHPTFRYRLREAVVIAISVAAIVAAIGVKLPK